jgi:hypothetical protein
MTQPVVERGIKSKPALGFLTVVDDARDGLFGGYLVLNLAGRPLEFHCTAPIKPNRAQRILYGPTLEPYLFGEQIGQTLVNKGRIEPRVVCIDREAALAVGEFVGMPVVLVLASDDGPTHAQDHPPAEGLPGAEPASASQAPAGTWRLDAPHGTPPGLIGFRLGRNRLAVPDSGAEGPQQVAERLAGLSDAFDLAEPFQRIREAIEEARRGGQ